MLSSAFWFGPLPPTEIWSLRWLLEPSICQVLTDKWGLSLEGTKTLLMFEFMILMRSAGRFFKRRCSRLEQSRACIASFAYLGQSGGLELWGAN